MNVLHDAPVLYMCSLVPIPCFPVHVYFATTYSIIDRNNSIIILLAKVQSLSFTLITLCVRFVLVNSIGPGEMMNPARAGGAGSYVNQMPNPQGMLAIGQPSPAYRLPIPQ